MEKEGALSLSLSLSLEKGETDISLTQPGEDRRRMPSHA